MKKIICIIGGLIAASILDQPRRERDPHIVNNYYIKNERSSCGGCGGNCKCGGHDK